MKRFLVFLLLASALSTSANNEKGPTNDGTLFSIGRSVNENRVMYDIQLLENGDLDPKEPIKVYWVKYTKNGVREDLNYFQRKLGYGLTYDKITPDHAEFHFVSYSKRELYLNRMADGSYRVFIEVDGKQVILEDVFINIDGGTFFVPNITEVHLHTKDPNTGSPVNEVIRP